jgi:hypothetical protein
MQVQISGTRALYQGGSAVEVLEAIRKNCPYPEATLQAWMEAFSGRMCKWDGKAPVDCTSAEIFLSGLQARGAIHVWP